MQFKKFRNNDKSITNYTIKSMNILLTQNEGDMIIITEKYFNNLCITCLTFDANSLNAS